MNSPNLQWCMWNITEATASVVFVIFIIFKFSDMETTICYLRADFRTFVLQYESHWCWRGSIEWIYQTVFKTLRRELSVKQAGCETQYNELKGTKNSVGLRKPLDVPILHWVTVTNSRFLQFIVLFFHFKCYFWLTKVQLKTSGKVFQNESSFPLMYRELRPVSVTN